MFLKNLSIRYNGDDAFASEASLFNAADVPTLCEEILNQGADLRIRVTGQSMRPAIKTNDVVTVKKVPAESLKLGDLILTRNDSGSLILHRLIKKERDVNHTVYRTKGDNSMFPDVSITHDKVLGKVYKIEKQNKHHADFLLINLETMRGQLFQATMMLLQLIISFRFRIRKLRKRITP